MNIGDRIKKIREANNLSQTAFGKTIGKSMRAVQSWESNISEPPLKTLREITNTFNISHNWLLTGEGEMFVNPSQGSKDSKIKQLYPTPSQNSSEQDEEFLLTLMLSVDEWLKEEGLTMDPDKKINLIKLLRKFYTEHTDKITTDSVKNYAIPFALKLIN